MVLYFVTNSQKNSKNANTIQTSNMLKEFIKLQKEVIPFWYADKFCNISLNKNSVLLPKLKTGPIIYGFISFIYIILHSKFLKNKPLIYSRNFYVVFFFRAFNYKNITYEVHSIPKTYSKVFFKLAIESKYLKIVSITKALKEDLILKYKIKSHIFIIPDAHPVPENVIKKRISKINLNDKKEIKQRMLVGYYGSLKDYKGFKIIKNLINKYHNKIDFIIRSKEDLDPDLSKKCFKYGFLEHKKALEEMIVCDCLLMPLQTTGKLNDISGVTSPLKLFEYLSSGVPLIASDSEVLKEVITHKFNSLLAKDYEDFYDMICLLQKNHDLNNMIRKNALETSIKYTYTNRAIQVLAL